MRAHRRGDSSTVGGGSLDLSTLLIDRDGIGEAEIRIDLMETLGVRSDDIMG